MYVECEDFPLGPSHLGANDLTHFFDIIQAGTKLRAWPPKRVDETK